MDFYNIFKNFLSGAGDAGIYMAARDYIYASIDLLTENMLSKNLSLALALMLGLLTLWIMVQGILIATGRSQEGLKGFIFGLSKSYFIIMIALGVSSSSVFSVRTLTEQLTDEVGQIITGSDDVSNCLQGTKSFVGCKIDKNLMMTQGIMGIMNTVDTAESDVLEEKVEKAKWFAGVGSAGPAVVAGTMLILYRIAMSLFIGFAPLFILSLLFKRTAPLFSKWLYYGLATIFSNALLGAMSTIAMNLTKLVGEALFFSDLLNSLLGKSNDAAEGIMQAATQQLGLGLMLSTLLVVVPPMAGMWFNGMMGSFSQYSILNGWNSPQTPTGNPMHDRAMNYSAPTSTSSQGQGGQEQGQKNNTFIEQYMRMSNNNANRTRDSFGSRTSSPEPRRTSSGIVDEKPMTQEEKVTRAFWTNSGNRQVTRNQEKQD